MVRVLSLIGAEVDSSALKRGDCDWYLSIRGLYLLRREMKYVLEVFTLLL